MGWGGDTWRLSKDALNGRYVLTGQLSAFGTKRTSESTHLMSAFGGKADIAQTSDNVRYDP
jgi:hypothetical protein